jgi:membrane protein DedA with SNARE-associated domain
MTFWEAIWTLDPEIVKNYIINHKDWAGPILCGFAFGESLVLVGLFFPATFIMVFAGLAIQQGELDPKMVIGWSIAGAVAGDAVTYWIGRWIGPSIVRHWPVNRHKTGVAQARLFFRKYGFLAIFIGRFLGPVRPTIPLVGGIMRMPQLSFQAANVASSIVWVPFMLFWGYAFSVLMGGGKALTAGHWAALGALVVGLMVAASAVAAKFGGKSAAAKREERKRDE